jgi:hypothetical protein
LNRLLIAALALAACQDVGDARPHAVEALDAAADGGHVVGAGDGGARDAAPLDATVDARTAADARVPPIGDAAVEPDARPAADGAVMPDASPDCAGAVTVQAHLTDDHLYVRSEAAEIPFTVHATGAVHMAFSADAGGRFTPRDDRVFWAAGGGQDHDVAWPWWTGPVHVTVRATDGRGCAGEASVAVTLAGDVLMTDGEHPGPLVYGSDGRYLGRLPPVGDVRGLGAVTAMPAGLAIVIPSPFGLLLLDRTVRVTGQAQLLDNAGQALFTEGRVPPTLAWWPARHELVAAGADAGVLPRWNDHGAFAGKYVVPTDGGGRRELFGFAFVGDALVVGRDLNNRLFRLRAADGQQDALFDVSDTFHDPASLAPGLDGSILAVIHEGPLWSILRYDTVGNPDLNEWDSQSPVLALVPFIDSYLELDENGVHRITPDLRPWPGADTWDMGFPENFFRRAGLAWLDARPLD